MEKKMEMKMTQEVTIIRMIGVVVKQKLGSAAGKTNLQLSQRGICQPNEKMKERYLSNGYLLILFPLGQNTWFHPRYSDFKLHPPTFKNAITHP